LSRDSTDRERRFGPFFVAPTVSLYIESGFTAARARAKGERFVTLTCPNCGNDRNFQVKTLQMHVVHLEDNRVEVSEESRPAVLEVLCDECESALKFEEFEDTLRKEVLLTIGAR
jgi:RNase P subunit RPR2